MNLQVCLRAGRVAQSLVGMRSPCCRTLGLAQSDGFVFGRTCSALASNHPLLCWLHKSVLWSARVLRDPINKLSHCTASSQHGQQPDQTWSCTLESITTCSAVCQRHDTVCIDVAVFSGHNAIYLHDLNHCMHNAFKVRFLSVHALPGIQTHDLWQCYSDIM